MAEIARRTIIHGILVQNDYDAIVIGGGPAGSFAALRLAQAGRRALVIDRREPGEGKTCGHCLNPRGFPLLREAGLLARVKAIAQGETRHLILRNGPRAEHEIALSSGEDEPGLIVPRGEFDNLLLRSAEAAGAHVLRRAAAGVWRSGPEQVVIEVRGKRAGERDSPRRHTARLVIGADGLRSGVARAMGFAPAARAAARGSAKAAGLSFDLEWSESLSRGCQDAIDEVLPRNAIAMHVSSRGYIGIVRCGARRVHVGALIRARSPRGRGESQGACGEVGSLLDQFPRVSAALETVLHQSSVAETHAAGPMPWRPRKVAGACAALVGDAAGYAEPFTGEGLSWALESAELLARAVQLEPRGSWSAAAAQRYDESWRRAIRPRIRRCAVVAALLRSRLVVRLAPSLASLAPSAARAFAREIAAPAPELSS